MSAILMKNAELNLRPLSGKGGLITVTNAARTYANMTGMDGTGTVSVDTGCTHVALVFEGTSARERADGTAPTSTVGIVRPDGAGEIIHVADFQARQWIRTGGSDTKIWVQQLTTG